MKTAIDNLIDAIDEQALMLLNEHIARQYMSLNDMKASARLSEIKIQERLMTLKYERAKIVKERM